MVDIVFFTGFSDIELAGNQSLTESLRYYAQHNNIRVFSLMPKWHRNLANPNSIHTKLDRCFHRSDGPIAAIITIINLIKQHLGKKNISNFASVDHFSGHNAMAGFIYNIAPFFAILVELFRGFLYCVVHRPQIIYGVNSQGAWCASVFGRVLKIKTVTRFHGTVVSVTEAINQKPAFAKWHEYLAIKMPCDLQIMTNDGTNGDIVYKNLVHKAGKQLFLRNGIGDKSAAQLINIDMAARESWIRDQGNFNIVMISRLIGWKRVDRGLMAFAHLRSLNKNTRLIIAGDGPDRQRLIGICNNLDISSHVEFLGAVHHAQVLSVLNKCAVFWSLYDCSNMANPVIEALGAGLPIISMADGSLSDLVSEGENGHLIESTLNTIPEIATKTNLILQNVQKRNQMCVNSRSVFVKKILSWKQRMSIERSYVVGVTRNRNIR